MSAKIKFTPSHGYDIRRLTFRTYALCIFVMVFCVNAPAPLFELFRRSDGLTPSELSELYAIYAGVIVVVLSFCGRFSDQFGRRSLVVFGLGAIAIGSFTLAMASSFVVLISGRSLQGLGVAAMSAPAATALAELIDTRWQASSASTVAVALAAGGASAPLFSGVVAEAIPSFPTSSLLCCAGIAAICLVVAAILPDPRCIRDVQPSSLPSAPITATMDALEGAAISTGNLSAEYSYNIAFWQACAAVIVCFGAHTTFFTVSGPVFSTLLASHVLLTAGCAMCAFMVASGVGSIFARRLSASASITRSMLLLAPGVCGFFGLNGMVPFWALVPAIAAMGVAHGLGYAGAIRLINETSRAGRQAAYMSSFYVAVYIGGGLPVLSMGVTSGFVGQKAALASFSFLIITVSLGLLGSLRLSTNPKTDFGP